MSDEGTIVLAGRGGDDFMMPLKENNTEPQKKEKI